MRAQLSLREAIAYRRDAFAAGLERAGFRVESRVVSPAKDDVLVIWNRHGQGEEDARRFEAAGARVVVAENGHLGKAWRGGNWYALALGHHAGAGDWPYGGPSRWDGWGVELGRWRHTGGDVLIFGQRGIGESAYRSPPQWAEQMLDRIRRRCPDVKPRIRPHPDALRGAAAVRLDDDLAGVMACVTWNSTAAASVLLAGVPVFYDCPTWIGAQAGLPAADLIEGADPKRDDAARLAMFRRMAWAMWDLDEIASGAAFRHLLRMAT